jgi:hypothetical protein
VYGSTGNEQLVHLKVKVFCTHDLRHIGGSRGIAPIVLNVSTIWRRVVSLTHSVLYLQYPLNMKMGMDRTAILDVTEKRKIFCPNQDLNPWIVQPIALSVI